MGKFGQDAGVTFPLVFLKEILWCLMTTESQDLGLTSHPKDAFHYLPEVSIWGSNKVAKMSPAWLQLDWVGADSVSQKGTSFHISKQAGLELFQCQNI